MEISSPPDVRKIFFVIIWSMTASISTAVKSALGWGKVMVTALHTLVRIEDVFLDIAF